MKERIQPERTCAVCRAKAQKENFVRVVKDKNGQISIDKTYKMDGRGMYICANDACINKAIKTRAINRSFKTNVDEQIYEELAKENEHKQG